MNWSFFVKLYLCTVPVFFLIDIIWLGVLAKGFYRKHLESVINLSVNWPAAIVFYLLFIAGILLFAVAPALDKQSWYRAAMLGGLFGLFTYATYDLTNLATIKGWPMTVVLVDILWGITLCATVATASYALGNWLK